MDNLITFLKFRGDIPIKKQPFGEIDAMIFSVLAGINYEGVFSERIPLNNLYERYLELGTKDKKDERIEEKINVLKLVSESKRYADFYLDRYEKNIDKETETTFYGLSISAPAREHYIVYRGTDGSLLSWKENFNSICAMPTAGQQMALKFLSEETSKPFRKCTVIGHSKGGNLAVYAAVFLQMKLQKRIKEVFAFDAPGYPEDISCKLGYLNIKDRIRGFIPEGCVIGKLMNPPYEKSVVHANGNGVYQHDLFNWELTAFETVKEPETNLFSDSLSKKFNEWVEGIPINERENVVNELFDMFKKNGINHIVDLMHIDLKKIVGIIMSATSLSSQNRALLGIIIKELRANH